MTWPGPDNRIAAIRYTLMTGFDAGGNPAYVEGTADEVDEVQSLLEPLHSSPRTIASVTMGQVVLELEDGSTVTLHPVFHPSRDRYGDLFMTEDAQYRMPEELAELLERWRRR